MTLKSSCDELVLDNNFFNVGVFVVESFRIVTALIGMLHAILDRHKRPITPPPSPDNGNGPTSSLHRSDTSDRKLCTGDDDWRRLDDNSREVAALVLSSLAHVYSWAPLNLASSFGDPRHLLDAVFHCAVADGDGPVGEAALGVLVEIVGKNWVPVECHDFLGAVFRDTFRLLRHVLCNSGDKLEKVGQK